MIEITHIVFGFASLIFGFMVVLSRKGTGWHRQMGRIYAASMLGLNLTAFGIYQLFDGWGFFHWMAVASLIPLVAGYLAIRLKKLEAHYYFMFWSFIGLLCATVSEIFVHIPAATQLLADVPNIDSAIIIGLIGTGFYLLPKNQHKYVGKT